MMACLLETRESIYSCYDYSMCGTRNVNPFPHADSKIIIEASVLAKSSASLWKNRSESFFRNCS